MPDLEKLMTASELFEIRQKLGQTPQSMAALLDCNINTYYHYERGGNIKASMAMAIRYLATKDIKPITQPKARTVKTFLTRFIPGARFGHLVVEGEAPRVCGKRRFKVVCDCGTVKTMSAPALVQSLRCGSRCTAGGLPPSPSATETRPRRNVTPPALMDFPPPPDIDPDAPDLDAPEIEWLKYHDRKEREAEAASAAASATNDEMEMEAGL